MCKQYKCIYGSMSEYSNWEALLQSPPPKKRDGWPRPYDSTELSGVDVVGVPRSPVGRGVKGRRRREWNKLSMAAPERSSRV